MCRPFASVWRNPFNGKCTHGETGARIDNGRLRSPICGRCTAEEAEEAEREWEAIEQLSGREETRMYIPLFNPLDLEF